MVRTMFAWSVVVLAVAMAGCRMCASPYDDCRPTFTGECGQGCLPNAREGSILSHGVQPVSGSETMLPVPGEVIYETAEVVVADEAVSLTEDAFDPSPASEPQVRQKRPLAPPRRIARSWRPAQQ